MIRKLVSLLVIIFFLLIAAPSVEKFLRLVPEQPLYGSFQPSDPPQFSWQNFWHEDFQKSADAWVNSHLGFRSYMIKTDNQISYSLFHEIANHAGTKIVLGKNNYLYEKGYIDTYNKLDVVPVGQLEARVANLKKLQDALLKRGKAFLFVISASKPSIYPEYLPQNRLLSENREQSNYEKIAPLLKKYQINVLDSHEYFTSRKATSPYPFYVKSGTHWDHYGACLIASELINNLEKQLKKNLVNLTCDPAVVDNNPTGTDKDLLDLTNIWTTDNFKGPTPHPAITAHDEKNAYRPSVLFVGDSFVWNLVGTMEMRHVVASRDFFYYFSKNSKYPEGSFLDFDKQKLDWEKNVFSRDAIIIEANEPALTEIGFGFVDEALRHEYAN